MPNLIDLTGQRFGRLTVIGQADSVKMADGHSIIRWRCSCDCGNETIVRSQYLRKGVTMSCGCLHKERFTAKTHGESKTRLYRIWCAMKDRCYRRGAINYKWYGGKGIRVCREWDKFEPFRDWANANGYSDDLTIDRINTSLDYSPENCRWVTRQENASIAAKAMQAKRRTANA